MTETQEVSEMVERVARALCDDTMSRWRSPVALQKEPWGEFIPAARAMIEAMREPTSDMKNAGGRVEITVEGEAISNDREIDVGSDVAAQVWVSMIDAALETGNG